MSENSSYGAPELLGQLVGGVIAVAASYIGMRLAFRLVNKRLPEAK